jgi:hypothetical protein
MICRLSLGCIVSGARRIKGQYSSGIFESRAVSQLQAATSEARSESAKKRRSAAIVEVS